MAWQTEMVYILRHLIDDYIVDDDDSNATYANTRLEETILVAAQLVQTDGVEFSNTYLVDVDACTLSPDPTVGTKDNAFINLAVLKAACIIISSSYRTAASQGIRITDGPSTIDLSGKATALKDASKEMCERYESAKTQFNLSGVLGQAILTPYKTDAIDPYYGHFS